MIIQKTLTHFKHLNKLVMKKVLLIVFKIIEVGLYFAACYPMRLLLEWAGLFKWLDYVSTFWLIVIVVAGVIVVVVWVVNIFDDWIELNKKWVNKILK